MAAAPTFFGTPRLGSGLLSVANANRDGSGSIVAILTAGANGTRLETANIKARDTTTGGMVRFFMFDGTSTYRLLHEEPVLAVTPSGILASFAAAIDWTQPGLFRFLPSPWSIVAATHNAEAIFVEVWGADF